MPGEMGGENCSDSTKVFCDETDPKVVSVDHSGERYDCPEKTSCLGSTSRRQMVNGGRIGTYTCPGIDELTLHILSLTQSTSHPPQIQPEMNWPNNFGVIHSTSFHDRMEMQASIPTPEE